MSTATVRERAVAPPLGVAVHALVDLSGVGRRYSVGTNEVVALADVSLRVTSDGKGMAGPVGALWPLFTVACTP